MKSGEYRFRENGNEYRVIVAGNVIALPDERWSMGGFGATITTEWLLSNGRLPKVRAKLLAHIIVRALEQHHRGVVDAEDDQCKALKPCEFCRMTGWVPA